MMNISEEHKRLVKLYAFTTGATSPTPKLLCEDMVYKLNEDVLKNPNNKFLDPCAGTGTFGAVLYERLLKYHSSDWIMNNMIFMVDISSLNCDVLRKIGFVNVYNEDFLKWETRMKFDVIVGNPPYQEKVGPSKTEPVWNKFVEKAIKLCNTNGYVAMIHPSGWRNIEGKFKYIQKLILSKKVYFLSIHNEKDGLETFGAETRYDYYVLQNVDNTRSETMVRFQDGQLNRLVLDDMEFIPNGGIDLLNSLIAKEGEEKVELLCGSAYHTQRLTYMSKTQTQEFQYPCVYTVDYLSNPTFWYSSTNSKGHFGSPKVIWSNGRISSIGNYIDETGEFGLTQFAYAIVDEIENLENIKKALDSKKFKDFMELCAVGQLTVNHKIVSKFKKDFWKEFI